MNISNLYKSISFFNQKKKLFELGIFINKVAKCLETDVKIWLNK